MVDPEDVVSSENLGDQVESSAMELDVGASENDPEDVVSSENLGDQVESSVMELDVGASENDPEDVVSSENLGDRLESSVMEQDVGASENDPEDVVSSQNGPEDVASRENSGDQLERDAMDEEVGRNGDEVDWTPRSRMSSMSSLSTISEDSDQPMVGVESDKEPSDMMEVDGEDGWKSLNSSEDLSEAGPSLGVEGTFPMLALESNQAQLDSNDPNAGLSKKPLGLRRIKMAPPRIGGHVNPEFVNCLDDMDSSVELRRSSRKANSKTQPTLQLAIPPKSSNVRRKPAQKKDEILLQVSLRMNSTRKGH